MSRLLRPDVRCSNPKCRKYPRLRVYAAERERYSADPPERVIATYQCHDCGTVYEIRAGDMFRAA